MLKNIIMKTILIPILVLVFLAVSCRYQSLVTPDCVHGRYVGRYCGGDVIQILDGHKIGKDWRGIFDDTQYTNSVVASIDSLLVKRIDTSYFSEGYEFYFQYTEGGYGRKTFENCEPSASITITSVSKDPCLTFNREK
jgi:hypothetical protein